MNTLICILILSICYWRIRNLYYNRIELQFRYDLYKLRDKLRMYAIDNKINANDWIFDYLDSSICKAIKRVTSLNVFLIVWISIKNNNVVAIKEFSKKLQFGLDRNEYLKEVYDEYGFLIFNYFQKKHYLVKLFMYVLGSIILSIQFFKNKFNKVNNMIGNLRIYPETSTGQKFYHSH